MTRWQGEGQAVSHRAPAGPTHVLLDAQLRRAHNGPLDLVERDLERAERAVELLERARADDRRGDGRPGQEPGQRHVRRLVTKLLAQSVVALE